MKNFIMVGMDICILLFSSIGCVTSSMLLLLVYRYRRRIPVNSTSILLACNTYAAILIGSTMMIDMYAHNLYGDLYSNVSFNNWWCYLRFYFLLVGFSSIYQSYLLQACFHLFRVVFYKLKRSRSNRFIRRLIYLQWSLSFLLILPAFALNHIEYLPNYYHCQIVFSNLHGLILVAFPIYFFPMFAILIIYISIICFTRWKTRSMVQRRSNRRDLIVLRRITILVVLLWFLTFPFMILWLIYVITGYLDPLSYHLQWLTFALSLLILPFASTCLTPQLKRFLKKIQRIRASSRRFSTHEAHMEITIDVTYSYREGR